MSAKAVYASGTFSIYLTRDDLEQMITTGVVNMDFYIGKTLAVPSGCFAGCMAYAQDALELAVTAEKNAIKEVKSSKKTSPPETEE